MQLRKAWGRYAIATGLPLDHFTVSMGNRAGEYLGNFMDLLAPNRKSMSKSFIPSRSAIRRMVHDEVQVWMERVVKALASIPKGIPIVVGHDGGKVFNSRKVHATVLNASWLAGNNLVMLNIPLPIVVSKVDGTFVNIADELHEALSPMIDLDDFVFFASDGAEIGIVNLLNDDERFNKIMGIRCMAHLVDLEAKDISVDLGVYECLRAVNVIHAEFARSDPKLRLFDQQRAITGTNKLVAFNDTRWLSRHDSVESVDLNFPTLMQVFALGNVKEGYKAKVKWSDDFTNVMTDAGLPKALKGFLRVFKPLRTLNITQQGDHGTMGSVLPMWERLLGDITDEYSSFEFLALEKFSLSLQYRAYSGRARRQGDGIASKDVFRNDPRYGYRSTRGAIAAARAKRDSEFRTPLTVMTSLIDPAYRRIPIGRDEKLLAESALLQCFEYGRRKGVLVFTANAQLSVLAVDAINFLVNMFEPDGDNIDEVNLDTVTHTQGGPPISLVDRLKFYSLTGPNEQYLWGANRIMARRLRYAAKFFIPLPSGSAMVERVFSMLGHIAADDRSKMTDDTLRDTTFIYIAMRTAFKPGSSLDQCFRPDYVEDDEYDAATASGRQATW